MRGAPRDHTLHRRKAGGGVTLAGLLLPSVFGMARAGGDVILAGLLLSAVFSTAVAGDVVITVDPNCVRDIGGITRFDRNQFITIHESFGSSDMDVADFQYIEDGLEAAYGRDGGFLSHHAQGTRADPANADMPDIKHVKQLATEYRRDRRQRIGSEWDEIRETVLCTHPHIMHAMSNNTELAWGPRTYESIAEFTAQFLKHYFRDDDRPRYLEVFNEPFVKAKKIGTTVEAMCEQHNVVAKRVKELNPDVLVGGYAAAWVEVEDRNFGHWNSWQRTFMDIAGANMDFFSYHIYDGVNVMGEPRDRTGSNSEAIMDLIDTYSHIKWGVAKPIMITEYGKIPEGNMRTMQYSAKRSARMLYSFMGQAITFMDHPDRLMKTIPFILGKALWTYGMENEPVAGEANPFLIWRRLEDGSFVQTHLSLFYRYWKGFGGDWRKSDCSNPDVRVQLLVDGRRLNLALMNLDNKSAQRVTFSGLEDITPASVRRRSLTTHGDAPVLQERELWTVPDAVTLAPGESSLFVITLARSVPVSSTVREDRVYATEYLKDIGAGKPLAFTFPGTPTGDGAAILRVSPGRELGKAVLPQSVTFNGEALAIPTNWAGSDQAGRKKFFGMIEFKVPMKHVRRTNRVEIVYPDSGGKLACVVLQVNRSFKL